MRTLSIFLCFFCSWAATASAAMYGDFAVPDTLHPRYTIAKEADRIAVGIPLSSGGEMLLYLPDSGEVAPQNQVLETIARAFDQTRDVSALNLGGRPWFGSRTILADGTVFYNGLTHRNGMVYPVGFLLRNMDSPDNEVKRILSRVWIFPGLEDSPITNLIVRAADQLETGEYDAAEATLRQARNLGGDNWVTLYLQGRLEEMRENLDTARDLYRRAQSLYPRDAELAAKALGMDGVETPDGQAVDSLYALSQTHPDEPEIWEELARIYLMADDMDTAKEYFLEALATNPASETALYNLAFIYAQDGEYEETFRRVREFLYYRPWLPKEMLPDVSGAPGMNASRVRQIVSEPLPLGYLEDYAANLQAWRPGEEEIARESSVIYVQPPATVVYQPTYVYESYTPVVTYAWSWAPRYNRRPGSWSSGHNRPSWNRPYPLLPGSRPPQRPGVSTPSRPGRPGGNRPGQAQRPDRPSRPGANLPSRPNGSISPGRPGNGNRPGQPSRPGRPENDRPGQLLRPGESGQGNMPPAGTGRPGGQSRPELPFRPSGSKPAPAPSRPSQGVRPEKTERPAAPPASSRPSRPAKQERDWSALPFVPPGINAQPKRPKPDVSKRPQARPTQPARPQGNAGARPQNGGAGNLARPAQPAARPSRPVQSVQPKVPVRSEARQPTPRQTRQTQQRSADDELLQQRMRPRR